MCEQYGEVYYTGKKSGCPVPIIHKNEAQKPDNLSNSLQLENLEKDTGYAKKGLLERVNRDWES